MYILRIISKMAYKTKNWEKIGDVAKPRYQNMYGFKGKKSVIWLDNWDRGNWAVVQGEEIAPMTYKEKNTYMNVDTKKHAIKGQKQAMEHIDIAMGK